MAYRCKFTFVKYQYDEVHELDRALSTMSRYGIDEASEPFQQLYRLRSELLAKIGFKIPRPTSLLKVLAGLSPGSVKVWHDAESGWFSEARERPGAPPVYKHVSDDIAMTLLKGELTKELELELMKPDDYMGE